MKRTKKYSRNDAKNTYVTPSIISQIPVLTNLQQAKKLKGTVHFDMLHILSNNIDFEYINEHCENIFEFNPIRYSVGVRYSTREGIYFSLLGEPNFFGDFVYQIQVNPKNFESFSKLRQFVEQLIGEPLTDDNHKINRIDLAFTVSCDLFSASLIHHSCAFKWKRGTLAYITNEFKGGEMTGMRTVSKSMDFCVYDRAAEQRAKTKRGRRQLLEIDLPKNTRFEYQIRGCSLDSLKLRTLDQILLMNVGAVFKRLKFYDLSVTYAQKEDAVRKFEMFQVAASYLGFQQARLKYNRENNNNFDRDIGRHLVPLTVNEGKAKVGYCLKKRFSSWFLKWKKDE